MAMRIAGFLASTVLPIPLPLRRLRLPVPGVRPCDLAILQHLIASGLLPLPALRLFDPGNGAMGGFQIEPMIDFYGPVRVRVNPIDGNMQMDVIGIAMQRIECLMTLQAQFIQEDANRLIGLLQVKVARLPARTKSNG